MNDPNNLIAEIFGGIILILAFAYGCVCYRAHLVLKRQRTNTNKTEGNVVIMVDKADNGVIAVTRKGKPKRLSAKVKEAQEERRRLTEHSGEVFVELELTTTYILTQRLQQFVNRNISMLSHDIEKAVKQKLAQLVDEDGVLRIPFTVSKRHVLEFVFRNGAVACFYNTIDGTQKFAKPELDRRLLEFSSYFCTVSPGNIYTDQRCPLIAAWVENEFPISSINELMYAVIELYEERPLAFKEFVAILNSKNIFVNGASDNEEFSITDGVSNAPTVMAYHKEQQTVILPTTLVEFKHFCWRWGQIRFACVVAMLDEDAINEVYANDVRIKIGDDEYLIEDVYHAKQHAINITSPSTPAAVEESDLPYYATVTGHDGKGNVE